MSSIVRLLKSYPSLPIIGALLALFSSLSPYFFTPGNAESILLANSVVLIAAVGMTMVFLTGGIDLSIATVISATAVVAGVVMASTDSVFLGTCAALFTGLAFGLLNGICVGFFGLNPFITTMGTALVARGIAFTLSEGIAVKGTPDALLDFGFELAWGIPYIMLVGIAVVIVCAFVMSQTTWGRQVMLFGSNRNAARYCGMNTRLIETSVYVLSGLLAGIAGMMSIANLGNALPGVGDTLLLLIIGGVVLGGTHMNGGEGSIMRTVLGVTILAILTSGLNLMGIPFYDQLIVQGALIFVGYTLAMKLGNSNANQ
ncbi:ABC transporter permease [Paraglaciecola aquimarina]|uniref:ABC transporter permease n=1 Tax=Paraglaciecola aquimarina TaxID=1235557 RepID=A0ABU3SYE9_9ALTE|nr:ABC transporter permease [Paraglaciecola aquimarina]MDU0354942.1 ABC transporter permease [Paraglaciecola aquimarina]